MLVCRSDLKILLWATWFVYYCCSVQTALATLVNITVDDADSSILYTPSGSWYSSSVVCSACLNPGTKDAFQNTYHYGTHAFDNNWRTIGNRQETEPPESTTVPRPQMGGSRSDARVSAEFSFTGQLRVFSQFPTGISDLWFFLRY